MSFHLEKYLDGEKLFHQYWLEMGHARSLLIMQQGFPINPKTGKRFTRDAGYKAIWRWACLPENYEKAWNIFHLSAGYEDWLPEQFKDALKEKALFMLTKAQYRRYYG